MRPRKKKKNPIARIKIEKKPFCPNCRILLVKADHPYWKCNQCGESFAWRNGGEDTLK
jgi:ribosomal protein L37AE/L43A